MYALLAEIVLLRDPDLFCNSLPFHGSMPIVRYAGQRIAFGLLDVVVQLISDFLTVWSFRANALFSFE